VLADKKHYANLQSYNYYQVSEIYKANKNVDSALSYLERHLVLKDSLEGQAVLEELAALRIQFDSEKKEKEILNQRTEIAESKLAINQKNSLIIGLVILAVVLSLLGYLIYNQQKLRNSQLKKENELKIALAKIETQNRLQEQRLSISRDLHDNIGAQLTFVISSIDNLKYGSTIKDKKLENKLEKISDFTSSTIIELRDTIWAMNKSEITYEDLKIRTINFLEKADFAAQNINFEFKTQSQMDEKLSFSSFKGMNFYRIIQEAVNNAIKYAEASNIDVYIYAENERVTVDVRDNGKGFDVNIENDGNGLNNIKKRAADIGAELDINSSSNGTQIKLMV